MKYYLWVPAPYSESQEKKLTATTTDTTNSSVGSKPAIMGRKRGQQFRGKGNQPSSQTGLFFFVPKSKVSPDLCFFHLHPLPILEQTIIPKLVPIRPVLTWKPKDAGKNERMLSVQEGIAGHSLPRSIHGCVARLQG